MHTRDYHMEIINNMRNDEICSIDNIKLIRSCNEEVKLMAASTKKPVSNDIPDLYANLQPGRGLYDIRLGVTESHIDG